jgi:hypothetical protein
MYLEADGQLEGVVDGGPLADGVLALPEAVVQPQPAVEGVGLAS